MRSVGVSYFMMKRDILDRYFQQCRNSAVDNSLSTVFKLLSRNTILYWPFEAHGSSLVLSAWYIYIVSAYPRGGSILLNVEVCQRAGPSSPRSLLYPLRPISDQIGFTQFHITSTYVTLSVLLDRYLQQVTKRQWNSIAWLRFSSGINFDDFLMGPW